MYYLARQWNVDAPEIAFPRSRKDVLEYLGTARFPILVKLIYTLVSGLKFWQMEIVNNERELLDCYEALERIRTGPT